MTTTRGVISQWYDRAVAEGATHMIIVCDDFDYTDYPVSVLPDDDVREVTAKYDGKNMQRLMEVYNLSLSKDEQVNAPGRVYNF